LNSLCIMYIPIYNVSYVQRTTTVSLLLYSLELDKTTRLAEEKAQLEEKVERLQDKVSDMESKISTLSEQCIGAKELYGLELDKTTRLSVDNAQLKELVEQVKATLKSIMKSNAKLLDSDTAKDSVTQQLKSEIDSRDDMIRSLRVDISKMEMDKDELRSQLESVQNVRSIYYIII
jgi:predicted nuclease with TOPRIM domain